VKPPGIALPMQICYSHLRAFKELCHARLAGTL